MAKDDPYKPRKPTGLTGPVHISFEGTQPTATFLPLDFPTSKAEVESLIAETFLSVASRQSVLPFAVIQITKNPTDDYDFTLNTSTGQRHLELLEVAPREHMSSGHQQAPSSYNPYDFAQAILQEILTKSSRYDTATVSRTVLLLYETHWTFAPSVEALGLLQYFTLRQAPRFERIYWYHPIGRDDGIVEFVYPTPAEHWKGFDPESWRDVKVHNLDPHEWKPGSD